MTTPHDTAPPSRSRGKQQQPKSAVEAVSHNAGGQTQRRQRRNPPRHGRTTSGGAPNYDDDRVVDTDGDSMAASSDEVLMSAKSRKMKKHNQQQPSPSRIISPRGKSIPRADAGNGPSNPSATPAKPQGAYAGPTFHASPAPSALPKPKLLSKSVPAKPQTILSQTSGSFFSSGSPPSQSPPSPTRGPVSVPRGPGGTTLDLLFRADQEERARTSSSKQSQEIPLNSAVTFPVQNERHHVKVGSNNSSNVMFPIELDSECNNEHRSPSAVSSVAHRSATAPSNVPQGGLMGLANHDSSAVQDLMGRLSQQQATVMGYTPPRGVDCVPSEPSSRHQSPSLFHNGSPYRSASGPTTPAPHPPEQPSNFFYGNRNLSPLFKAAKSDVSAKRNSGLRTEIMPDSPVPPSQGAFPSVGAGSPGGTRDSPRNIRGDFSQRGAFRPPISPRRGSMPNMQASTGSPNNWKSSGPGRRPQNPRPDSYSHPRGSPGSAQVKSKPPTVNPFIPASVQAKQFSTAPKATEPKVTQKDVANPTSTVSGSKVPDSTSLELDLKRLLDLKD